MSFRLGDDGTLDTVVVCEECGVELRYNYDGGLEPSEYQPDDAYNAFVEWALGDATEQHECGLEDQ